MQGLRERGKQRRRDDVLLAARALIVEGGMPALTMRALAERSGVSVPTIYGLVGGREAVLAAMLERGGEQFDAALAGAAGDPIERLFDALDVFSESVIANEYVVRAVFASGGGATDTPGAMRYRLRDACAEAFAYAQRNGVIDRTCSAADLAAHVDAFVVGGISQWASGAMNAARLRASLRHGMAALLAAHARPQHQANMRRVSDRAARAVGRASQAQASVVEAKRTPA